MDSYKSHTSKDPRITYCSSHSLRLHPVQEKLIEPQENTIMTMSAQTMTRRLLVCLLEGSPVFHLRVKTPKSTLLLLKRTKQHECCGMLGSTDELQLIMNLLKMIKAKKTIDVGVYTGYSALSVALVLPADGKVVACDISEEYASIGKPFWKEAGVDGKIDLRIAPAGETMQSLIDNGEAGTYDFVFIDADKIGYDNYYEKSLILLRPGGFMAIDNALMGETVLDENNQAEDSVALRKLNAKIHKDMRVDVSLLTIGDGTSLVFKPHA